MKGRWVHVLALLFPGLSRLVVFRLNKFHGTKEFKIAFYCLCFTQKTRLGKTEFFLHMFFLQLFAAH